MNYGNSNIVSPNVVMMQPQMMMQQGQPMMMQQGQPMMMQQGQAVITQQGQPTVPRLWSSGICACCDDMESCCCTLFFAPCYSCYMFSKYDECCMSCICVPAPIFALRIQHRNRHRIEGTILSDCCTTLFCGVCAQCQLKRDMNYVIKTRGSLL